MCARTQCPLPIFSKSGHKNIFFSSSLAHKEVSSSYLRIHFSFFLSFFPIWHVDNKKNLSFSATFVNAHFEQRHSLLLFLSFPKVHEVLFFSSELKRKILSCKDASLFIEMNAEIWPFSVARTLCMQIHNPRDFSSFRKWPVIMRPHACLICKMPS